MKMKKTLKISLLIVAICFVVGCGKDDDEPQTLSIVGTWYFCVDTNYRITYTFNSDNTMSKYTIWTGQTGYTTYGTYEIEYLTVEYEGVIYNLTKLSMVIETHYGHETDEIASLDLLGRDASGDYLNLWPGYGKGRRYNHCE